MTMRLFLGVFLLAFTADYGAEAPASARTEPIPAIWQFNEINQIGGHTATVVGTPKIVDQAGNKALYFNGATDGLLLPLNPLEGFAQFTVEVLINPSLDGEEAQRFLHIQDGVDDRALLEIRLKDGHWALDTFLRSEKTGERCTLLNATKPHAANRWTWVALVYQKGHMAHFVDGVKELEGAINLSPMGPGQMSLGMRLNKVFWYKGGIREVRFHAVALDAAALQKIAEKP